MRGKGKYRIIVDTNLWISFLIGKRIHELFNLLLDENIEFVFSVSLKNEIVQVASRQKFQRYFSPNAIKLLQDFLDEYAVFYELTNIPCRCRDPKDDFLLELSIVADADYLVSGDDDLLSMRKIANTEIVDFSTLLTKLNNEK